MKLFSLFRVAGLLVGLVLAGVFSAAAQAPAWQSARAVALATAAAANNGAEVRATAVDAAGNVYLAGAFTNTVGLGGTILTSRGSRDTFVAKFSPVSNQFLWAQRAGGTRDDYATALAISGTNVYMTGVFSSFTADFGANVLTNVGDYDVFVTKLTDAGNTGSFTWAQQAGGIGFDQANALAVSGASLYVAGFFGGPTADFGPIALTNVSNTNTDDVFVAKLTDAGNTSSFIWAQRAGGIGFDNATSLAVGTTGIYVSGDFASATAGFGATTLTSAGDYDVFVAKLTDLGNTGSFLWAQRAGGADRDQATALAVRGTSVYLAGGIASITANFGAITLTNAGDTDVFVAKLTDAGSTGSFTWAQRAGGANGDVAMAVAVSGTSLYVAGLFRNTAGFGATNLTSAGDTDMFVAKLTDLGNTGSFLWAQRAGGTANDVAYALAVSGTVVYVSGVVVSTTSTFSSVSLTNPYPNTALGFLAAITDPTLTGVLGPAGTRELAVLYPNPAQRMATLRLPAGTAPAPMTLTDALGRTVSRYPAPAGPESALDLQGLPAGLYLLRGAGPALRLAVE